MEIALCHPGHSDDSLWWGWTLPIPAAAMPAGLVAASMTSDGVVAVIADRPPP